ncbi:heparinase II/III family protein [Parasediminibacterium sp. JCM 36343]|uniref:heparinase II/III domain-containing protein n=1 Tax=Parasediminibacterium sp. JCM 36343 TaxID=3374279 RepID=UPI003978D091
MKQAYSHYLKLVKGVLFSLFFLQCLGQAEKIDTAKITGHPRLLLLAGQEEGIKKNIAASPYWGHLHNTIINECDVMLALPPVQRVLIGRRLLDKSREAFRRIFFLSYAWRITHDRKYFNRCEAEMLAMSKFSDWNPSHFLDVAEMTMAVSIGYDWLYADLSQASREAISKAIIAKGIEPSLDTKYNGWMRNYNNWNQVCNAGITFGALAVYEQQPTLSVQLIARAFKSIQIPMKAYVPDGTYPEGYMYWAYGTSFNVFFVDALQNLFGTDYGLSAAPGFGKTASFYENMLGPTRLSFNYSDASNGANGLEPAMFWFANQFKDPTLLWQERDNLMKLSPKDTRNRFLPAAMLWGKGIDPEKILPPSNKIWDGKSENPVALMRTSWQNPSAIYVGLKGGSPSASHGHMDVGSFVMDADGVRWSMDLGMQEYESLESKGVKLWDMGQDAERWQVFRYNNLAHSTLAVNNGFQLVKGNAKFISHSSDSMFMSAALDMSSLYKGLAKAQRGIAIIDKQYVSVRDELETGDSACTIRWAMVTSATVGQAKGNQIQLENKGKKLTLFVDGLKEVRLRTWPTDPQHSYDALNPGTTIVGFEITLPAHTKQVFNVLLVPGEAMPTINKAALKGLSQW